LPWAIARGDSAAAATDITWENDLLGYRKTHFIELLKQSPAGDGVAPFLTCRVGRSLDRRALATRTAEVIGDTDLLEKKGGGVVYAVHELKVANA